MDRRIVVMLALVLVLLAAMTSVVIKVGLNASKSSQDSSSESSASPDVDESDPLYFPQDDDIKEDYDDEEGFYRVRYVLVTLKKKCAGSDETNFSKMFLISGGMPRRLRNGETARRDPSEQQILDEFFQ